MKLSFKLGKFDTLLMFGNGFGLFGNPTRAKWLLKRFHRMMTDDARIIAESLDPYMTDDPDHRIYQNYNKRRRRMAGQIRIRVRYRKHVTPWFDFLLVSPQEMRSMLKGTEWEMKHTLNSPSAAYIAIIEKTRRSTRPMVSVQGDRHTPPYPMSVTSHSRLYYKLACFAPFREVDLDSFLEYDNST
jgi:hypothetical protein